ncbi:hypothetical protein [Bosea sp. (in: a-proteobacteria)]|uniref:AtuA-related protein n=1 Tax=Bosea sp. (in: a-proteobacteria) TaxID=1871050 RepID=UPI00260DCB6A|nr:hypothetical protein [Bosea sp. (in: a-proteobacteria)]MCO5091328.1 hypothetical protein [Bosea sp. (in: a-proteobacteria)]
MSAEETLEVALHEVAHSRTGDKGNRVNASLIAYDPAIFPLLAEQVTAERVARLFSARGPVKVCRYDLPLLAAFNFVIDDVLEGGVNGSLNLDGHGKTLSFFLLTLPVRIPRHLLAARKRGFDDQPAPMRRVAS